MDVSVATNYSQGTARETAPQLGVLATLLTYNGGTGLMDALNSIELQSRQPDLLVVFDNASSDGTAQRLESFMSTCTLRIALCRSLVNIGVGAGHNTAISCGLELLPHATFVWLLEHDSQPLSDCLQRLLFETTTTARDATHAVYVPRLARSLEEQELVRGLRGTHGRHSSRFTFNGPLLPLATYKAAGKIREDLFVGFEDWDYSQRLVLAGYEVQQVPEAIMIHPTKGNRRAGVRSSPTRAYYSVRNEIAMMVESGAPVWSVASVAGRASLGAIRDARSHRFTVALKARLKGVWDGVRGRLGPMQ